MLCTFGGEFEALRAAAADTLVLLCDRPTPAKGVNCGDPLPDDTCGVELATLIFDSGVTPILDAEGIGDAIDG